MKTIFITSFHVLISRNIFSAPFFKLLTEDKSIKIVLVVPEKKILGIKNPLTRLDDFLKDFALAAVRTRSLAIMRARKMGLERPLSQKIFFWAPIFRHYIPRLYSLLLPDAFFKEIFGRYQPAVIFSTDVFSAVDCRIMLAAKRRSIPIVGMVRSWDNLTTKGGFRVIPNLLVVHNEIIKKEAIEIHNIDPAIIKITGIPHYDNYLLEPTVNREQFLDKFGMGKNDRFVVYAPLGDRIMKVSEHIYRPHTFDRDMIKILDEVIPKSHHLLVRFPPTDSVNLDGANFSSRVILERPGTSFGSDLKGIRTSELSSEDDKHLINTIFYCDFVLTPFSSIAIDAALLDKPVIILGFDPYPVSYIESVERLHEFNHYKQLFISGGVCLVKSRWELDKSITNYLADLAKDKEERKNMIREQCFKVDGQASQRLFDVVEKFL